MTDMTQKWCWWLDGDERFEFAETEAEAHDEAMCSIDNDVEPGEEREYEVARVAHPLDVIAHDQLHLWIGEHFHQHVDEMCADETGAEDVVLDITDDDRAALGKMVIDFLRQNAKVQWWGMDKKTKTTHTYVAGSNDDQICPTCSGSGEGMHDGTTCKRCRGKGVT